MGPLILVTGLPRSGTSLVAGVIRACGAWAGETTGPSPHNRKGNVENEAIREGLLKPYLSRIPACPLGIRSLPMINHKPFKTGADWRRSVAVVLGRQGYKGGPFVYKDAKIALVWKLWAAAFPDANWVIVRRPITDVVRSACAAEPMMRHFDSPRDVCLWVEIYRAHVESIVVRNWLTVTPGDDLRPMVNRLGLQWNEPAVNDWIDWSLYHGDR